jgi:hypothetical protein
MSTTYEGLYFFVLVDGAYERFYVARELPNGDYIIQSKERPLAPEINEFIWPENSLNDIGNWATTLEKLNARIDMHMGIHSDLDRNMRCK